MYWVALVAGFSTAAVIPVTVRVIQTTNQGEDLNVDNVPALIAVPLSFTSTLMIGLTEKMEKVYTTPDDLAYTKTGMLFGNKVMNNITSSQMNLLPSYMQQNLQHYMERCVIPDALMGNHFTWAQLKSSPNPWDDVISTHQSPIRGIKVLIF